MSTTEKKFQLLKRYGNSSKNIWNEFTQMVSAYKPLDLSLGFPDFSPSTHVTNALAKVANSAFEQDSNPLGRTNLSKASEKFYSKSLKRTINSDKEIITMASGCQSLYLVIMSLVEENDEVIIIEPYFDFYEKMVNLAGGECKFVPLRFCGDAEKRNLCTSDFISDIKELESVFSEKTRLFILNTPNNPSGKVFNSEELRIIANLCKKWNVICLSDEVYEFFVYPPYSHVRIATLPDMWERTITIVCPGKTFGVTGWELGVAYSSEEIINLLRTAHQNIVHSENIPIQEAYAISYEEEMGRLQESRGISTLPLTLKNNRDIMIQILRNVGMEPIVPEGGIFILAEWSIFARKLNSDFENARPKDIQFVKWMIKNFGLAVLPSSSFYSEANECLGKNYIRLCFYKKPETLYHFSTIMQERSKTIKKDLKM